jgi:hypothetical protein
MRCELLGQLHPRLSSTAYCLLITFMASDLWSVEVLSQKRASRPVGDRAAHWGIESRCCPRIAGLVGGKPVSPLSWFWGNRFDAMCYCTLRAKSQTESFTPCEEQQFPAIGTHTTNPSLINTPIPCKFDSPTCKNYPVRFTSSAGKCGSFTTNQQIKDRHASRIKRDGCVNPKRQRGKTSPR